MKMYFPDIPRQDGWPNEVGGVFGTLTRERGALEGQNDMCSAARCKNTSLFASMS